MKISAEDLEAAIEADADGWYEIEIPPAGKSFDVQIPLRGSTTTIAVAVEVVENETAYDDPDSYGESYGRTNRIVLKLGSTYYLKQGRYESYVGSDWSAPLREVKPVVKSIVTYE